MTQTNIKKNARRFRSPQQRMVALWLLRVLVPASNFRFLFNRMGYAHDEIAEFLCLPDDDSKGYVKMAHEQVRGMLAKFDKGGDGLPDAVGRNMAEVTRILKLSPEEVAVLVFFAALKEFSVLAEMMKMMTRKNGASHVAVIALALGLPRVKAAAVLASDGRLIRSGLLKMDAMESDLEFHSRALAARIFSRGFKLEHVLRTAGVIVPPEPELSVADFESIADDLAILLPYLKTAIRRKKMGVNILLHGMPGTGKTQLSRLLAQESGVVAHEFSMVDEDGDGMTAMYRLVGLRVAQSFLNPGIAVMVFDEMEDVLDSAPNRKGQAGKMKGWFNKLLEENPNPVIWISNSIHRLDPAFCRRFDYVLEVPMPGRAQRTKLLKAKAGKMISQAALDRLADVEELAPAVIERAASVIGSISGKLPAAKRDAAFVRVVSGVLSAQGHGEVKMDKAGVLVAGVYDISNLNADADLASIASGLRNRPSGRLCLYGPPGTGKTAFGHWLAREMDRPLLLKKASDLLAPYLGETEANLARAFKSATDDGAVLMIDEMDSFLQSREKAQRSWEVTQVNEMLTQIEAFDGVLIGSTNLLDRLDAASMRRFDVKIRFDYLSGAQVLDLLGRHCAALGLAAPWGSVAEEVMGWTCATPGDFAAAARRHRFQPYRDAGEFAAAISGELAMKSGAVRRIGFLRG